MHKCQYNIAMRNWRRYIAFILVAILVVFAFNTVEAQIAGEDQFPGNIILSGDFYKFYHGAPDPQLLFGNAISNVMDEAGTPVQYFDRARFELKETDQGLQVQLARLGFFQASLSSTDASTSTTCRYFPTTGHRVCYDFLQFYNRYDGEIYFGDPVSEMIPENGQLVQYFEYARFEYRFNMPANQRVGLTNIGRLAMKKKYGTAPLPVPPYAGPARLAEVDPIHAIHARAFVSRALVAPGSTNTLYVVVQLPDYKGVTQAKVNVTIQVGDKTTSLPMQVTNADGIAKIEIPAFDLEPRETVQLMAVVNYGEQTVKTSTWYRIWY